MYIFTFIQKTSSKSKSSDCELDMSSRIYNNTYTYNYTCTYALKPRKRRMHEYRACAVSDTSEMLSKRERVRVYIYV